MDAIARDRNVDLVELHPPFPLGPRRRRTATPPTADGPKVRTVECGTSLQIVVGRLLGPERHSPGLGDRFTASHLRDCSLVPHIGVTHPFQLHLYVIG